MMRLIKDFPEKTAEFETLHRDHHKELYRFVFRLLGDADDADDVLQDTYIKLHSQFQQGVDIQEPRAWLFRVAGNSCYTLLKRRETWRQMVRKIPLAERLLPGPAPAETVDAEESEIRREQERMMRHAYGCLRIRDRLALELFHSGLSYDEIAASLGVGKGSVGKLLTRARRRLELAIKRGERE